MSASPSPGFYAAHMERLLSLFAPLKAASYERLGLGAGQRVLDLGCGPGIDAVALAERVGQDGEVVGIDSLPTMLEAARARAEARGVGGQVTFRQGDATSLVDLGDASFDAARSERLFQHLADPAAALREMVRVTRPGGAVVVLDTDYSTITIDIPSSEAPIGERLKRFHIEHRVTNGCSGRQLRRLFLLAGLREVTVEALPLVITDYGVGRAAAALDRVEHDAHAAGAVTREELERWRGALQEAERLGAFFMCLCIFLASGRTPA